MGSRHSFIRVVFGTLQMGDAAAKQRGEMQCRRAWAIGGRWGPLPHCC